MATRLMLLPYLQGWDGQSLSLRLLCGPQGNPMEPLLAGEPSFATANFQFEVRLIQGLAALPTLSSPVVPMVVASPAPARALDIFQALERTLPIDPTIPPVSPRVAGSRFLKYAPLGYRAATGFSGSRSPYVITDDRYRCAIKAEIPPGTPLKAPPPKISWGKVLALALRQPLLAQAAGLVRPLEIKPPADFFAEGGWIYVSLAAGSPAAALATTPGALKFYAARVPPLETPRSLFSAVLFPVAALPPVASYDAVFQEVLEYDDGFAKAVYAAQSRQLDPLQEEDDDTRPANDAGVQLGWDDEQIALWLNRQIDPAHATEDAPAGVFGYRVDARKAGETGWHSLVLGETRLVLDRLDLGSTQGEFQVEIAPNKLLGDTSGTYWMPVYYTSWTGPSLAGPDPTALTLQGIDPRSTVTGIAPGLTLSYGEQYEFRVRLVDHTGGGPDLDSAPQNPSPQPTGSLLFQRWVRPQAVRLVDQPPVIADPADPPTNLRLLRPRLGYPAYVMAGGAASDLIADLPAAQAEGRGVGLPDLDVVAVEVIMEVQHPAEEGGHRTVYRTTREFPPAPAGELNLTLDWQDVKDVTGMAAPAAGPITLPTSRNVRLSLVPLGRDDANYFGAEDVRRGPATFISLRKEASDERSLLRPFTPSEALRGLFIQPEQAVDRAVSVAQKPSGNALAAPDNALGRLAEALDLEVSGLSLRARHGRRVLFGCSPTLRHVTGPDGASLTFASTGDLTQLWLLAVRVDLDRDWSWDGLDHIRIERGGIEVGRIEPRRSVASEARLAGQTGQSHLIYLDALDPKPTPGAFPAELDLDYRLVPVFRSAPMQADAAVEMAIHLPITTQPSQIPRLASAGVALSPYRRSPAYDLTEPRQRMLWLEFEQPPENPADGFFGRVLAYAPDPALLRGGSELPEAAEPPLPIDPEPIRTIVPGQSDDQAGLGAMQSLVATDSPRHFLLPLPPGMTEDSPELFGFFTYELRAGHRVGWSTAQGRFGRPLRVAGVQHPAPTLLCQIVRHRLGIEVTAPFANPVFGDQSLRPFPPVTEIWILLYAQVVQADGADRRNILLDTRQGVFRPNRWDSQERRRRFRAESGTATWSNAEVVEMLKLLGLSEEGPLSCLAVETLPGDQPVADPIAAGLGYERFLRTSPLTPIPKMCG